MIANFVRQAIKKDKPVKELIAQTLKVRADAMMYVQNKPKPEYKDIPHLARSDKGTITVQNLVKTVGPSGLVVVQYLNMNFSADQYKFENVDPKKYVGCCYIYASRNGKNFIGIAGITTGNFLEIVATYKSVRDKDSWIAWLPKACPLFDVNNPKDYTSEMRELAQSATTNKFFAKRVNNLDIVTLFIGGGYEQGGDTFRVTRAGCVREGQDTKIGNLVLQRLDITDFDPSQWIRISPFDAAGLVGLRYKNVEIDLCIIAGITPDLKLRSMYGSRIDYPKYATALRLAASVCPDLFTTNRSVLVSRVTKSVPNFAPMELVGGATKSMTPSEQFGQMKKLAQEMFPTENTMYEVTASGLKTIDKEKSYLKLGNDGKVIAYGALDSKTCIMRIVSENFRPLAWGHVEKPNPDLGIVAVVRKEGINSTLAFAQPQPDGTFKIVYTRKGRQEESQQILAADNPKLFNVSKESHAETIDAITDKNSVVYGIDDQAAVSALSRIKDFSVDEKKTALLKIIRNLSDTQVMTPITRIADLVLNDDMVSAWEDIDADEMQDAIRPELMHKQEDMGKMKDALQDLNELDAQSGYERGYIFYLLLYTAYDGLEDYYKLIPKPMKTPKILKQALNYGTLTELDVKGLKAK